MYESSVDRLFTGAFVLAARSAAKFLRRCALARASTPLHRTVLAPRSSVARCDRVFGAAGDHSCAVLAFAARAPTLYHSARVRCRPCHLIHHVSPARGLLPAFFFFPPFIHWRVQNDSVAPLIVSHHPPLKQPGTGALFGCFFFLRFDGPPLAGAADPHPVATVRLPFMSNHLSSTASTSRLVAYTRAEKPFFSTLLFPQIESWH